MKTSQLKSVLFFVVFLSQLISPSVLFAKNQSLKLQRFSVLYVYGDVSAKGNIPSGPSEAFEPMRLSDSGPLGLSIFKQYIEEIGAEIIEMYDASFTLDTNFLSDFDVIILASNQRRFASAEAKAVENWVRNGGGLIVWSDSAFGGHWKYVGVENESGRLSDNDISEQFGMYFLTDNGAGNYLVTNFTQEHFLNNFNAKGGVRIRGEGISLVRTSPPAIILAMLENGGLNGKIRVNEIDAPYQKDRDSVLSILEYHQGRVIGLFDRNMFWNGGAGTRITHVDHIEFSQRLILWAANKENLDIALFTDDKSQSFKHNVPPSVVPSYDSIVDRNEAVLRAKINYDGVPNPFPEVEWSLLDGPFDVKFDNDNRFTSEVYVTFGGPGKYTFTVTVNDGDLEVVEYLDVSVD
ncbi:DUF4350 domain-containing protein [Alteromonas oceanisediminis]|uniref:DUF4350 domain-containing protein n=1 Tax=Alteromonas oceanisediminis TaxID=2836180 RepID=UPI001BD970BF|nr:DUF4350 domain-containing protein [Alteromonas oceanisediminis]MBT0586297.1 hypothetical protein [Alteromonas oceanisediminis]